MLSSLLVATLAMVATSSFAQMRPRPGQGGDRMDRLEMHVREMDQRVRSMQDQMQNLDRRLDTVERYLENLRPHPHPRPTIFACMLVDTLKTTTFLGTATSQLDAQYAAEQNCEKTVNAMFCKQSPKCDSNDNRPEWTRGFTCLVTDSLRHQTYRGQGQTAVEAEAKAKISCQANVNPMFCGKQPAQCEVNR